MGKLYLIPSDSQLEIGTKPFFFLGLPFGQSFSITFIGTRRSFR
jgi:hypothetical protein